jgi:hypothetical protein
MLLGVLQELRVFADQIADPDTTIGFFAHEERFARLTGNNQSTGGLLNILANARVEVGDIESRINQMVYDLYHQEPEESELVDNWLPLLDSLRARGERLEVFTTNYDVVLEEAIRLSKADIAIGKSGKTHLRLDVNCWKEAPSPSRLPLLTKLHGSINWSRSGETIYIADPTFHGAHSRHVILYPAFKGTPTEQPFNLFHEHLARVAQASDVVIFVGYAFRDQYINDVLARSLPAKARIISINPNAGLLIPFAGDRETVLVERKFDQDSVLGVQAALEGL